MSSPRIRVLVVDDSALVRKIITDSLAPFQDIEVVGTAPDPYVARDKMLVLCPDVLTLDIEMPRMDGLTFLQLIMKHRPTPVVVFSSLTGPATEKALEALQLGAVEVLGKPGGSYSAFADGSRLAEKIRAAAQAKVPGQPAVPAPAAAPAPVVAKSISRPAPVAAPPERRPTVSLMAPPPQRVAIPTDGSRNLILMGASTGGTEALRKVLTMLPAHLPGICIVQHIPPYFSKAFADRLNQLCQFDVREAVDGDVVRPGLALVAPGGKHVCLTWRVNHYVASLNEGPMVHHQRPAVDVLFDSAVRAGAGPNTLVVILTGMGADGAKGMLSLHQAGAHTIAQDEQSCVVFGMPREAIRMGGAKVVLPLDRIAGEMVRFCNAMGRGERSVGLAR